jgi:hypothetical protein
MIVIALAAAVAVLRPQTATRASTGYKAGDVVDLTSVPLETASLVIATRSTCRFCAASMPFYRSLTEIPIIWVAVGESVEVNRQYLRENGLEPTTIVEQSSSEMTKVRVTPSVALVDRQGRVIDVWVGQLDLDAETAVRQAAREALVGS